MHLQQTRGPKFVIPRYFRPRRFEYERAFMDTPDLEANSLNVENVDECVICMHSLRQEVDD